MTKEQLIAECKANNPIITQFINGEEIILKAQEYEKACEDWAEMRLQQIALQKVQIEAEAKREVLLNKLGISEEEAKLLLS